MYFKVTNDTELFGKLSQLGDYIQLCQDKSEAFVVRHFGGPKQYVTDSEIFRGGILAVHSPGKPKPKPKLWRAVLGQPGWFYPFASYLRAEISKMPILPLYEVREAIGWYVSDVKFAHAAPAFIFDDRYILVSLAPNVRGYNPIPGMVEILGSEFNHLADAAKKPTE